MTVAGRVPSLNPCICEISCALGMPASDGTSFVTLRPSVPWQPAQVAARLRTAAALSWARPAPEAQRNAAASRSLGVIEVCAPGALAVYEKGKPVRGKAQPGKEWSVKNPQQKRPRASGLF